MEYQREKKESFVEHQICYASETPPLLKNDLLCWSLEPGEKGVKSSWLPGPPSKCSGFVMCPLPHTLETLDVSDNRLWTNERSSGRYSRRHPSNHPKKARALAPKECRNTCVFEHGKCTITALDEYRQANMYSRLRLSKVNKKYLSSALASLSQPTSVPENCLTELKEKVTKMAVGLVDITKEEHVGGNENTERFLQWHQTKLNKKPPDKIKAHVSVVDLQSFRSFDLQVGHSSSYRAEQFCPSTSWTRPHVNLLKLKHFLNKVRSGGPHVSDGPRLKRQIFWGNGTLRESEWKSRKDCLNGSQQFGDVKQSITSGKILEGYVNIHDLIKGSKTYIPQKKESKIQENINLNQFTEDSDETILCNSSGHEVYTNDFKTMNKLENLFDKTLRFEINHIRQVSGNNLQQPTLIGGKIESSTQYDKRTSNFITNHGEIRIDRESQPIVSSKDTQTLKTPINNLEFIALKQLYKRYREETSQPKTFENTSHQTGLHSNDHLLDKKVEYKLDVTENLSNLNQLCLSAYRKQKTSTVQTDSLSNVPQNKVITKLPPECTHTSAKQVSLISFSQKDKNPDNHEQDQDEIRDGLCQEDEVRSLQINTAREQEYVQMKMLHSSAKASKNKLFMLPSIQSLNNKITMSKEIEEMIKMNQHTVFVPNNKSLTTSETYSKLPDIRSDTHTLMNHFHKVNPRRMNRSLYRGGYREHFKTANVVLEKRQYATAVQSTMHSDKCTYVNDTINSLTRTGRQYVQDKHMNCSEKYDPYKPLIHEADTGLQSMCPLKKCSNDSERTKYNSLSGNGLLLGDEPLDSCISLGKFIHNQDSPLRSNERKHIHTKYKNKCSWQRLSKKCNKKNDKLNNTRSNTFEYVEKNDRDYFVVRAIPCSILPKSCMIKKTVFCNNARHAIDKSK